SFFRKYYLTKLTTYKVRMLHKRDFDTVWRLVRPGPGAIAHPARQPSHLGFLDTLAHGRLASRGNSGGNVRSVLTNAQQDPGLGVVEQVHAQEVESRKPRDPALLHRKPICIKDRQVDPAIIKTIPRGPDHRGDTGGLEIQRGRGILASV